MVLDHTSRPKCHKSYRLRPMRSFTSTSAKSSVGKTSDLPSLVVMQLDIESWRVNTCIIEHSTVSHRTRTAAFTQNIPPQLLGDRTMENTILPPLRLIGLGTGAKFGRSFGLTTCGRPQLKLYYYYYYCHYYHCCFCFCFCCCCCCFYDPGLRPICWAGRRMLRPNLAPCLTFWPVVNNFR